MSNIYQNEYGYDSILIKIGVWTFERPNIKRYWNRISETKQENTWNPDELLNGVDKFCVFVE